MHEAGGQRFRQLTEGVSIGRVEIHTGLQRAGCCVKQVWLDTVQTLQIVYAPVVADDASFEAHLLAKHLD